MVSINLKTKLSVGPGGAAHRALLLSAVIFTAFWFSAPGFAASPTSSLLEQAYDAMWRGDMDAAVGYWESAAEAGDVTAQVNLGQVYRQGKGVPQSDEKATYWYTLASQQGSEVARYNLLLMRSEGRVQDQALTDSTAVVAKDEQLPATASRGDTEAPSAKPVDVAALNSDPQRPNASSPGVGDKPSDGALWINELPDTGYVMQLIALSNHQRIIDVQSQLSASGLLEREAVQLEIVPIIVGGETRLNALVLGAFASRADAVGVRARLPDYDGKSSPWIMPVALYKPRVAVD